MTRPDALAPARPRRASPSRRGVGFTLLELLVALSVVGILAAAVWPSYLDHVQRSRASEAVQALSDARAAMEQHFLNNRTYEDGPCATSRTVESYTVACPAAPTADTFRVRATGSGPTAGFVYEIDHHGTTRTLGLPSGWGSVPSGGRPCWITRRGQTC